MDAPDPIGFVIHFRDLPDPRTGNALRHPLLSVLSIAILAFLCGADSWEDVEDFGHDNQDWLTSFLDLPAGIPSHDTQGRVFAAFDPAAFESCFLRWTQSIARASVGRLICVDGKALRGSREGEGEPLCMVNAWCQENRLMLGQVAVAAKSNEITAVPELLELLNIKGAVVSLDAMHCQQATARKILDRGGDYLLRVKENQHALLETLRAEFDGHPEVPETEKEMLRREKTRQFARTVNKGHGRVETRELTSLIGLEKYLEQQGWSSVKQAYRVRRVREVDGTTSEEVAYGITSLERAEADASRLLGYDRGHWEVETKMHWMLDMTFREDQARMRTRNAAQNAARLRRMTANLLSRSEGVKNKKVSLRRMRKRCGWSLKEREAILKLALEPAPPQAAPGRGKSNA